MRLILASASALALALTLAGAPAAAQEPQRITGALEDGDAQLPLPTEPVTEAEGQTPSPTQAHRYDDHQIRLEAGRRYRISLNSEEFDPVARLYRAGQEDPVAENDDSGESLNSRISFAPTESGDYRFRVTGYSAEARGPYSVEVAMLAPLPEPITRFQRTEATIWRSYLGEIGADDPQDEEGKRFDDYRISFAAGQSRLIWVDSAAFDSMVQIYRIDAREGAALAMDDDNGGGLNALLTFTAEEAGDYVVRVTSFDGEQTGPYRLRVSE
jgi:hypothetical protein